MRLARGTGAHCAPDLECSCQCGRARDVASTSERQSIELLAVIVGEGSVVITVREADGSVRSMLLPQNG